MKHKLTEDQALRLGVPQLAGKQVDVTLRKDKDLAPSQRGKGIKMAKDVYYNGERLGGTLHLNE